jgi:hypothetical protein
MADEDCGNFLPPQVKPPQGYLGSLAAIKEEQLPFPPEQYRGEVPVRKGRHTSRTENKGFKVHYRYFTGLGEFFPVAPVFRQGIGVYFLNATISSKSNRFEEKTNHEGAPRRTKERGIGA